MNGAIEDVKDRGFSKGVLVDTENGVLQEQSL